VTEKKGSIGGAIFLMFFISLILFWLPFLGPLIAGAGGAILALAHVGPLLLGAIIGGILA